MEAQETKLKEIPILTHDEVPIMEGMILYTTEWESGYGFEGKKENGAIEAHKVFYVNNTTRTFRTRCTNGCESIHKVSDGCSRQRFFAWIPNAIKRIEEQAMDDLINCDAKKKGIIKTEAAIKSEIARVKKLRFKDIKKPK